RIADGPGEPVHVVVASALAVVEGLELGLQAPDVAETALDDSLDLHPERERAERVDTRQCHGSTSGALTRSLMREISSAQRRRSMCSSCMISSYGQWKWYAMK